MTTTTQTVTIKAKWLRTKRGRKMINAMLASGVTLKVKS